MATTIGALRVELSANIAKFEAAMGKAAKHMARTQRSFAKFGSQATAAGQSLSIGLTAPLVAVGALATKSFLGFDQAMTRSLAIMGDVSDAMRDDMATAAREVGKATSFSASEAAEAYFFLASAGLDAAQSVGALPQVASFAQAGLFDLSTATDLLTDAQSALGLTIRDDAVANMQNMARVSDVLVKANTLANASVQQFSEALTNKAANAMAQLNIDVESGVAVLAAWADQGIKGSEAGERFNIVTRDLQTAARKNADEFERFGIAVFDQAGNFRSLADIVADVEGALQGMSHEQQGATLAALGFTDRSISATRSLIGSSEAIRGYERDLRSAGGMTQEVADKQLVGLTGAWIELTSAVGDVLLEIGTRLSPVLERLAAVITDRVLPAVRGALDAFGRLSPEVQQSRILWLGFAAALGPALLAIGGVALALTPLVPLFGRIWIAAGRMSNVLVKALGHPIATAQALRARLVTLRTSLAGLSLSARASAVGVKLASVAMTGLRFAIRGVIATTGPFIAVFAAFEFAYWAAGALNLGDKLKRLVGITDDAADAARDVDAAYEGLAETLAQTTLATERQALAALERGYQDLVAQLERARESNKRAVPGLLKRVRAQEQAIAAAQDRVKVAKQEVEAEQAAARAATDYTEALQAAEKEAAGITDTTGKQIRAARTLGVSLEEVSKKFGISTDALKIYLGELDGADTLVDDLGDGVGTLSDEVQTLVDRLRGTGAIQAAHDWAAALDHVGGLTTLTRDETTQLVTTLDTAITKWKALGEAVPVDIYERYMEATTRLRQVPLAEMGIIGQPLDPESFFAPIRQLPLGSISIGIPLEPEITPRFRTTIEQAFQGFGASIGQTFARAFEGGGGFAGGIKSLFSQGLGQIFSSMTGGEGGGLTGALGKMFSGGGVLGKIGSIGTKIGGGIGKFLSLGLNGVPIVGPFLAAFGGPLLKGVGKLFKKMFGGPSEAELAGRKTAGAFRDGVIATLNDGQLAEAAEAAMGHWRGNEQGAQFLIGVRDAYVSVGRSAAEAEAMVNRLWAAEQRGPEAVAAVQREMQVVLDQAADLTARHQDIARGLEGIRAAGQAAFDPAQLDSYLAQMQEAGLLTAAQAGELRALADDAHTDWQAMEDDAIRYGVATKDNVEAVLGVQFAQAKLTDEAGRLAAAWHRLTEEGGNVQAVTKGMTDEAQGFVTKALEMGIALPAAMQPMIEKMIEHGRLTDQNGEKLTDLSGLTFAEPLAEKFDTLIEKLTALIDTIAGRGGVTEAIEGIPREVEVGVDLRYREHDRPEGFAGVDVDQQWLGAIADLSGVRALATGGLVTRPTVALLGERDPEAVLPLSQIGRMGTSVQVHVDARGALFTNEYTSQRELARIVSDVIVSDLEGTRRLGLH